eukprot:363371-Chlamydomonas_euryale.AAC.25
MWGSQRDSGGMEHRWGHQLDVGKCVEASGIQGKWSTGDAINGTCGPVRSWSCKARLLAMHGLGHCKLSTGQPCAKMRARSAHPAPLRHRNFSPPLLCSPLPTRPSTSTPPATLVLLFGTPLGGWNGRAKAPASNPTGAKAAAPNRQSASQSASCKTDTPSCAFLPLAHRPHSLRRLLRDR